MRRRASLGCRVAGNDAGVWGAEARKWKQNFLFHSGKGCQHRRHWGPCVSDSRFKMTPFKPTSLLTWLVSPRAMLHIAGGCSVWGLHVTVLHAPHRATPFFWNSQPTNFFFSSSRQERGVFTNSTFLEIPIRFLGLKNFSERIQSLQVVGIPIGIPRNSGY